MSEDNKADVAAAFVLAAGEISDPEQAQEYLDAVQNAVGMDGDLKKASKQFLKDQHGKAKAVVAIAGGLAMTAMTATSGGHPSGAATALAEAPISATAVWGAGGMKPNMGGEGTPQLPGPTSTGLRPGSEKIQVRSVPASVVRDTQAPSL